MMRSTVRSHVVCAGLPGPERELLALLVQAVLERTGRAPVAIHGANSAAECLEHALQFDARASVLVCDRPDLALVDLFARSQVPMVMAVPDLRSIVLQVATPVEAGGHGADLSTAMRVMYEQAAPLLDLAVACDPLLVSAAELADDFAGAVRRLSEHLGCDPGDASPVITAAEVRDRIRVLHREVTERSRETAPLPPPVDTVVQDYQRSFVERQDMKVTFGQALLHRGAHVEERRHGVLDLTGQESPITFGPNVCLPRGPWVCRYTFAIGSNAVGVPLRFFVTSHSRGTFEELARREYVPAAFGEHSIELPFDVSEPSASIEMPVYKTRAMFEGDFAIGEIRFSAARGGAPIRGALFEHLLDTGTEQAAIGDASSDAQQVPG